PRKPSVSFINRVAGRTRMDVPGSTLYAAFSCIPVWRSPRRDCHWGWPPSSSGHGASLRELTREEEGESHARAHQGEREYSLAGEPAAIHRTTGRGSPLYPHWRSRERYLRIVLHGAGKRHEIPGAHLRGPVGG